MISVYLTNPLTGSRKPVKYAFNINYLERSNNLFTAKFSLPATNKDTEKLKQFSFVEIYDGDRRVELFVVVKSTESFGSAVPTINYELLDALFLLNLSVIEYLQLVNPTTKEALEAVLDYQYLPYWKLGDCEFSRGFSYSWENENGLLDPLMSVVGDTGESYVIERDTTQFPFVLHFKRPPSEVSARVKQGYNMRGFTIEQEGKNLVNWILPKGNAEGINAVDIKKVNNNIPYLMDQDSMNEYFPAMTIWKDDRYTIDSNLKEAAQSRLDAWKEPNISWSVTAVDLTKVLKHPANLKINSNREIQANKLSLNSVVSVETEKHGTINLRVLERGKSDTTGSPGDLALKITNENINPFSYDEKRQQEISKVTANGAQNIIPFVFDREADPSNPVVFKFPVYEEVVNVNDCRLWINTTRYRATSKGNESAPTTVTASTTEGGGAYVSTVTSQSGGASVQSTTSEAAGQSTQTSSANGSHRHKMFTFEGVINHDWGAANTANVFMGYNRNMPIYVDGSSQNGDLYTAEAADNHTHSVTTPSHTHNVSVSIPAHTHNISLNIPNHTHKVSVTIPSHNHEMIFGIFEYSKLPSKITLKVDGTVVPVNSVNLDGIDLKDYLRKDSSGKVTRDSHTIEITPNDLARFEVTLMLTIFIKSRLGGKY